MTGITLAPDAHVTLERRGLELRWSPFSLQLALVPGYGAGFALTLTAESAGFQAVPLRYDADLNPLAGEGDVGPAKRVLKIRDQKAADIDPWLCNLLQGTFGSSQLDTAAPVIAACAGAPLSRALGRPATVTPATLAQQFHVTLTPSDLNQGALHQGIPARSLRSRARSRGVWI